MSQEIPVAVKEAAQKYHRLVLLVDRTGNGSQSLPQAYANYSNKSLVNLNIELSRLLLDIPKKERPTKVNQLVQDIIRERPSDLIIFRNIELLFDPSLRLDGLEFLKSISRNRNIVAFWPGRLTAENLIYAEPGHPEYKSYKRGEIGVVLVEIITER